MKALNNPLTTPVTATHAKMQQNKQKTETRYKIKIPKTKTFKYLQDLFKQRAKMTEKFNVIVEQGEDGYLISEVIELPGCHTQAKTYDELIKRTKEAVSLYLKVKKPVAFKNKFLAVQQIEVGA